MSDLLGALRRHRVATLVALDSLAWSLSLLGFSLARYLFNADATWKDVEKATASTPWGGALALVLLASALQFAFGWVVRLHHGRSALGSLEEMLALGVVVGSVGLVLTLTNLMTGRPVPGSVPIAATCGALVTTAWYRATYRAWVEKHFRRQKSLSGPGSGTRRRVIVFGAGVAGRDLIGSMIRNPFSPWAPVALLDDDPAMKHRRIRGVPVMGGGEKLAEVAEKSGAEAVIIAIPSASSNLISTISRSALNAGLAVKVLPSADQLLRPGHAAFADIRDVDVTDLLGRHQVDTDIEAIADHFRGKRVLVTGAGGSIGSELCRQIATFDPAELIMLDRDESALHAVQLSIHGKALLDTDEVVLADIRDFLYIDTIFQERKPQVVFHAAALKHLPMLEQYPGEAIKTNVWGTLAVLEAAKNHGVERFVNISTDKAADPCSVLGYSKRLAEGLTAAVAEEAGGTFLSVRFGNVLGSRGSVLTAFTAQIASGGPVTVTDPEVTRYFMTVQEAVQLVIQAGAIGRDAEVLVLDMGEAVSIAGVARQLIELSGKDIEVVYTGLRAGEKLHEVLWGEGEHDHRPVHPLISHTSVPRFDVVQARKLDPWAERESIISSFVESTATLVHRSHDVTVRGPEANPSPVRGDGRWGLASR